MYITNSLIDHSDRTLVPIGIQLAERPENILFIPHLWHSWLHLSQMKSTKICKINLFEARRQFGAVAVVSFPRYEPGFTQHNTKSDGLLSTKAVFNVSANVSAERHICRRRRHSLILRTMNFCDSARQPSWIVGINRDTVCPSALPTSHNRLG